MNDDVFTRWFSERYPEARFTLAARVAEQLAPTVIGLELAAATELAEERGVTVRIVRAERSPQIAMADWRADRINVGVVHGRVVTAELY